MKLEGNIKEKKNSKYIILHDKEYICPKQSKILIILILCIYFIILTPFKKKISNSRTTKYESNKSNIEILKIITYNEKILYEGAEKCLMKNPEKELCLYQFLCPKEVIGKNRI